MADNIWISAKVGAITLTIGGPDPATFLSNYTAMLGPESPGVIGELFTAAFLTGAETALHAQATTNLIDAGMVAQSIAPAETAAPPARPALASVPPASSGPKTETDNWNNVFTYEIPGAPACPHGARVQKKGTSKAGKPYTAWVCPTQTPSAYRNKVAKSDCALEFAR